MYGMVNSGCIICHWRPNLRVGIEITRGADISAWCLEFILAHGRGHEATDTQLPNAPVSWSGGRGGYLQTPAGFETLSTASLVLEERGGDWP